MASSTPRILIFGTGAVGITYAYILDKAGAEVTTICRSNYSVAKESGFTIQSKIFGDVSVRPHAVRTVEEACGGEERAEPFDYIVVCSKALTGPQDSAAVKIKAAVAPGTTIVIAQNGIGLEDEYRELYPQNSILSGSVTLPVTQVRPGFVVMGPLESLNIGTYPAQSTKAADESAARFAALFSKAGATCKVLDDIQPQRWNKLAINASWNPICCLARCAIGHFLRSSSGAPDLIKTCMVEVKDIARSLGYDFPDEDIERAVQFGLDRMEAGDTKEPSMVGDARNGRRLEVEAIVGNTVRIAKKQGVATPMLDVVYTLIKALDDSIARDQFQASPT